LWLVSFRPPPPSFSPDVMVRFSLLFSSRTLFLFSYSPRFSESTPWATSLLPPSSWPVLFAHFTRGGARPSFGNVSFFRTCFSQPTHSHKRELGYSPSPFSPKSRGLPSTLSTNLFFFLRPLSEYNHPHRSQLTSLGTVLLRLEYKSFC